MKALVVLNFEVPDGEQGARILADIIARIDPPALPFFGRVARIVPDPHASELEAWLDEE